jgi:hypothetical protein
MFNELFFRSDALTRQLSAPLVEERQSLGGYAKLFVLNQEYAASLRISCHPGFLYWTNQIGV